MSLIKEFKEWILQQTDPAYEIVQKDEDTIHLVSDYAEAEININMFDLNITEFRITSKKDGTDKFYLHFLMEDMNYMKSLFNEMKEVFLKLQEERKVRVLLFCTSGMTTGLFVNRINEVIGLTKDPYVVDYCPERKIYERGKDFDIILLAPQVSHMYEKVKDTFSNKLVCKIPATIFGSYDVRSLLKMIEKEYTIYCRMIDKEIHYEKMVHAKTNTRMLVLGVLADYDGTRIMYRVYDKGVPELANTIIKGKISVKDIEDVLDYLDAFKRGFDVVCLSVPGVVHDGEISFGFGDYTNLQLEKYLSEKYKVPFIICNNGNAIALGIYSMNNEYSSLIYHSHISGTKNGGEGIVANGHLITGKNGYAGEVHLMNSVLNFSHEYEMRLWLPETMEEIIAKTLIGSMSVVAPEAVYIRCDFLTDTIGIKKKIVELLRNGVEDIMPDLVLIKDIREYLFFGQTMICMKEMEKRNLGTNI